MQSLETERLYMRSFALDDLDQAYDVFEGHPDVWRFDPGHPNTREKRRELLQWRILELKYKGIGCMAVVLKDTGQLIGYCGLQLYLFEGTQITTPEVELFYKFGRAYWGQGYATEACQRMIAHAFETQRLHRLVTWTQAANMRSIRLLHRLGMRVEPAPGFPQDVIGILDNPTRA